MSRISLFSLVFCAGHRTGPRIRAPRRIRMGSFLSPPPALQRIQQQQIRTAQVQQRLKEEGEFRAQPVDIDPQYQLRVGALIQRDPLVIRELREVEKEYMRHRYVEDAIQSRGLLTLDTEAESGIRTAPDGTRYFNVAPEESEPPLEYSTDCQNVKNLGRHLDRKLYLAIRIPRAPTLWTLPSFLYTPPSKGNQGLQPFLNRRLDRIFARAQLYHLGQAPIAHFLEDLNNTNTNTMLATFYFKSVLIQGDVKQLEFPEALDYGWLTREEIQQNSDPEWFAKIGIIFSE